MAGNSKLSRTMRIDLIPETPVEPVSGKRKRVVITTPARKHHRLQHVKQGPAGESSAYQELLQSVYDAAIVADVTGKIVDVNVRAVEFLRYARKDLCSMTVFDIISGSDESLMETLSKNLENERFTLIQAYCIRENGSFFPSEIAVNRLRLDTMHLCFFVRDITLRRQAEEMLRTEHNAIQNSGNGIAVGDLEAKLEYVNPAVAGMWGYERSEELIGHDVRDMLGDRKAAGEMVEAVMGDHQVWKGEMRARRLDGGEFDVQVSATCNRNSDGEPVGMVFSFVDISDRKRAEEAIREAEQHRVMLESLGAACHHLGQPATILMANLGIIRRKTGDADDAVKDLIQSSIATVEKLGKVLHRLNAVNEYKTMQYLKEPDGPGSEESRILDI